MRLIKKRTDTEVWKDLQRAEPKLFIIKGHTIQWEDIDSAELPLFGEPNALAQLTHAAGVYSLVRQSKRLRARARVTCTFAHAPRDLVVCIIPL